MWSWEERPATDENDQPIDGVEYHADFDDFWYVVQRRENGWCFFSETPSDKDDLRFHSPEEAMRAAEKHEEDAQALFDRREAFGEQLREASWQMDEISIEAMDKITAILVGENIWPDE